MKNDNLPPGCTDKDIDRLTSNPYDLYDLVTTVSAIDNEIIDNLDEDRIRDTLTQHSKVNAAVYNLHIALIELGSVLKAAINFEEMEDLD